jgi:conjugative transfer region protein (TIGR03748 family)
MSLLPANSRAISRAIALAPLAALIFMSACIGPIPAAAAWPSAIMLMAELSDRPSQLTSTPVIRSSRYTLIEFVPSGAQRDLLQQVVDITFPSNLTPSVGDALRYVLLRSGYRLCDDREELHVLDTWPLPAAHLHLGPLSLRDALQVLVGPGWRLEADETARRICFAANSASITSVPADNPRPRTTTESAVPSVQHPEHAP